MGRVQKGKKRKGGGGTAEEHTQHLSQTQDQQGKSGRGVKHRLKSRRIQKATEATRERSIGKRCRLVRESKLLGAGGIAEQIVT